MCQCTGVCTASLLYLDTHLCAFSIGYACSSMLAEALHSVADVLNQVSRASACCCSCGLGGHHLHLQAMWGLGC